MGMVFPLICLDQTDSVVIGLNAHLPAPHPSILRVYPVLKTIGPEPLARRIIRF